MIISAADLARTANVDPKRFRHCLRQQNFAWHRHNQRWLATMGSDEHRDMLKVLETLR